MQLKYELKLKTNFHFFRFEMHVNTFLHAQIKLKNTLFSVYTKV